MKRKFSTQQLYELRNFIPIDVLIEEGLMIPCKFSEGFFRFLCPLCGEFQTSVKSKTNLARCFLCQCNFNTIDIVMVEKNKNFVQSVKFLETYRNCPTSKNSLKSNSSVRDCKEAVGICEILRNLSLKAG